MIRIQEGTLKTQAFPFRPESETIFFERKHGVLVIIDETAIRFISLYKVLSIPTEFKIAKSLLKLTLEQIKASRATPSLSLNLSFDLKMLAIVHNRSLLVS
jgi:hypothetical protein